MDTFGVMFSASHSVRDVSLCVLMSFPSPFSVEPGTYNMADKQSVLCCVYVTPELLVTVTDFAMVTNKLPHGESGSRHNQFASEATGFTASL